MNLDYSNVVKSGLSKQVADNLKAAIMDGRLKIDERLPTEDDLARSFGVSRPTIREALKRLAAQNLIHSRRGPLGGSFVKIPDPADLSNAIANAATLLVGVGAFDIHEIVVGRLETEAVCCRLACENRTDRDLAIMAEEIAKQQQQALSDEDFCASDVRFHRALVDSTGNGPLKLMMYTVVESFIPITNLIVFRVRERRRVIAFHQRIYGALRERDAAAAVEALSELLEYVRESYAAEMARRNEK